MKRSMKFLSIIALCAPVPSAFAVTATARPMTPRRQLINCMTQQMAASRTLSYNDASRLCKDMRQARNDLPGGSSTSVKTASAR